MELVVNFDKSTGGATGQSGSTEIQWWGSYTYSVSRDLEIQISKELTWSAHTKVVNKTQQHLYYLHRLTKLRLPSRPLIFFRSTNKSTLTGNITVSYGNTTSLDHNALKRVAWSAGRTTGEHLRDMLDIYIWWCREKPRRTITNPSKSQPALTTVLMVSFMDTPSPTQQHIHGPGVSHHIIHSNSTNIKHVKSGHSYT